MSKLSDQASLPKDSKSIGEVFTNAAVINGKPLQVLVNPVYPIVIANDVEAF